MTDNHEGKFLESYLEKNKISFAKLAELTGVTRQNIYWQVERELLSNSFKLKLKKAGISIFDKGNITNSGNEMEALKAKYVAVLEQITELQKENMKLKDELNSLRVGKSNR